MSLTVILAKLFKKTTESIDFELKNYANVSLWLTRRSINTRNRKVTSLAAQSARNLEVRADHWECLT